jgi:arylsulfatase A-like enzyme
VQRTGIAVAMYAALVLLAAANVPVGRVLSSPLTAPLLRAARGTLSDSLWHHATPANLAITGAVLAAGAVLPFALRGYHGSLRPGTVRALFAAAVAAVLLGPFATRQVDTGGLERNALFSLIRTSVPRVRADAAEADWRASPFASQLDTVDLTHLRGTGRGANVLLVVLESTAAQYLRVYGSAHDPMPNLTVLARDAVVFEDAYAVYPESIKGLVSILASRYPALDVAAERHARFMSPSLATVLDAYGYRTALFHSGRFFYLGMEQLVEASGFRRNEDAGEIGGNHDSSFGIDESAAVRRILEWIDTGPRAQPFFVTYLPIAGHHPYAYATPGPFPEDDDLGRYRNALHEGDIALGQLMRGLESRGLADSTLIVVIGDHGEAFGQHAGNFGHNLALYEENVRVPFIIALPGEHAHGTRVPRSASLIDVSPTVLDLLGIDAPRAFHGESRLDPRGRMALFFTDYSLALLGLRDGCRKFIHELESGRSRLFDVCGDPGERHDLATEQPEQLTRYRERLRRWSAAEVARVGSN